MIHLSPSITAYFLYDESCLSQHLKQEMWKEWGAQKFSTEAKSVLMAYMVRKRAVLATCNRECLSTNCNYWMARLMQMPRLLWCQLRWSVDNETPRHVNSTFKMTIRSRKQLKVGKTSHLEQWEWLHTQSITGLPAQTILNCRSHLCANGLQQSDFKLCCGENPSLIALPLQPNCWTYSRATLLAWKMLHR